MMEIYPNIWTVGSWRGHLSVMEIQKRTKYSLRLTFLRARIKWWRLREMSRECYLLLSWPRLAGRDVEPNGCEEGLCEATGPI